MMSALLAALSLLVAAVADQSLSLLTPDISALQSDGKGLPYYEVGDEVKLSWTTPYDQTTLMVFQAVNNANWTWDLLAVDNGRSNTTFTWSADAVQQGGYGFEMYFALENGQSITCDGCVYKSPMFVVLKKDQVPTSATQSATTTASSSAGSTSTSRQSIASGHSQTPMASSSPTSTPSAIAAALPGKSNNSRTVDIGLGVGLGVGLALLLAAAILICLFLRRRRQKRRISYHPTGSGNWTPEPLNRQSQVRETPVNRDSSTLGLGPGAAAWRESQQSASTAHSDEVLPPKPASRTSFLAPFDFEKAPAVKTTSELAPEPKMLLQVPQSSHPDNASSVYSLADGEGTESAVDDAAAMISPSGRPRGLRQDSDRHDAPIVDLSTLEGAHVRPQSANTYSSIVDWRNWPLEP